MKKWLPVCLLFSLAILGHSETYAEESNETKEATAETQSETLQTSERKEIRKVFLGRGNAANEQKRQLRTLRYSSLEASGLYGKKGDMLHVNVSDQDSLELVLGTPERNTQKRVRLNRGENVIAVENDGAIYITNPNDSGSALVTISGATGSMPYFDLNATNVSDFQKQMEEQTDAADVQLVSNKAMITVSYARAKKYLEDPKQLMEYYDKFLLAQDRVSGISDTGNPANYTDRHFQHFIEVGKMYMYATNEYLGFNGDAAVSRLLQTNNGWGIWHESGHQRQQSPWKWGSVTESTVNIYSMAAEKEVTGKIGALDKHYPKMHSYLNSKDKDFEKQSNELKMVFFGQLSNTFGDQFYPTLHQYYRENQLSYSTDAERIQNFMTNVSTITGYDMTPYFEQWGFNIDDATREKNEQLNKLPEQIWLNDNKTTKKLPMRLFNTISLSESNVNVALTTYQNNIFEGQKIVLIKNDQYIAELTNKKPAYSYLKQNSWIRNIQLEATDVIRIETRNADGTFQLYRGSIITDQLKKQLTEYLHLGDEIVMTIDQAKLDDLRGKINNVTDTIIKEKLLYLLETLEERYLGYLIDDISLNEQGVLQVDFFDNRFKAYNKIVILGNNKYIAEVAKGKPYYSNLSKNSLRMSNKMDQDSFAVQFRLPHKTYTVAEIKKSELLLKNEINALVTADRQLDPSVTQEKLDSLRAQVGQMTGSVKETLTQKINAAQQLFFESMITEINLNNNKVTVTFANDLFKNYKIVIIENSKYLAEVTNGKPYYGQLNNNVFVTSKTSTAENSYELEIRHSSGNYRIKK
ncbi:MULTISPECIES: M60 family metallopeptidase [unclassified Enterococcus]|uniref:M60 family metallopeptidase n=1 Tax=unclassified Enterococcus TaxID=2608891 RepID=UPI001CE19016|nr:MULTISPECIES: M60 family metallopeptidase [unclassified Enterococcus]MCA5011736.1 hypothetical protein [Enterococcus sp. S23]MCA5014822.1 hypothetical protein [Enterococcus sp. S22(2020)]